MKVLKSKEFNKAIILIKILEDGRLLLVDSDTTVRFLEKDSLGIVGGFKAKIIHQRYKTNVVAFSPDAKFFASISADEKEAKLYNTVNKKVVARANRHQGDVSCIAIDPNGRFMFSSGDDGKTFAYDVNSGRLAFTLPPHADTINDIAFSDNGQWVATASYDKKISIFNLAMMTPKEKLKAHVSPIVKLQFLSRHRLISADRNGSVIVWNIYADKVEARLQGVHDDVLQMTKSADDKFLFIGTALGHIIVYELEKYTQLARSYIKLSSSITSLHFDGEKQHLIIGTKDGQVLFYDIYEGKKDLRSLIQEKRYAEVEKFVKMNPLLSYTDLYHYVDEIWEKTISQAKMFLENRQKENARKILTPFMDIPSKKSIIQKTFTTYEGFDKFVDLVKQRKLALAYSMANANPLYKETKVYKNLEENWKKAFALAQKYALDAKGKDKAREILAPYRGISEKTIYTQELFQKGDIYRRFKKALGEKNFRIIFSLIQQHPFLKEFPDYDVLMNYGDNLYMKAHKLMHDGELSAAVKVLKALVDFPEFKDEVRELMYEIEQREKFFDAIKANNIVAAYKVLDKFEDLQNTPEGEKLQLEWDAALTQAEQYASMADALGVKKAFEPFMKISTKYVAMATIFSWCYITQLENALRSGEEQHKIENGIKNYVHYFGLQDLIESFYAQFKIKYPTSVLNIERLPKGSLSMWRPAMIVSSILD